MTDHLILILFSAVNLSRLAIFKFNQKWPTVWSETNKKWSKKFALYFLLKILEKYSFIIYSLSVKWDENMLGSVLAQRDRSETSHKWPRALLQISLSALGIQFGSRARRYNISRARRSVNPSTWIACDRKNSSQTLPPPAITTSTKIIRMQKLQNILEAQDATKNWLLTPCL